MYNICNMLMFTPAKFVSTKWKTICAKNTFGVLGSTSLSFMMANLYPAHLNNQDGFTQSSSFSFEVKITYVRTRFFLNLSFKCSFAITRDQNIKEQQHYKPLTISSHLWQVYQISSTNIIYYCNFFPTIHNRLYE